MLAVLKHYTIDDTYEWIWMCGHDRERGTIVSMWACPGVPAFGGKYITIWNSWEVTRYPNCGYGDILTVCA